jgi:hypothetical protein
MMSNFGQVPHVGFVCFCDGLGGPSVSGDHFCDVELAFYFSFLNSLQRDSGFRGS